MSLTPGGALLCYASYSGLRGIPARTVKELVKALKESVRDLSPIVLVVVFFQLVVLQQPFPELFRMLIGVLMVVLGLTLFVHGLRTGLFPIGEGMAYDFARKGSVLWLLIFAFMLGFGTTVAEPALIAVAHEAAEVAAQGGINAARNYANDGDSVERLFRDTVRGGDFRAREANVYRLAQVANNIIDQCVAQGIPFAREYGGYLANRSFGGAQVSRTFGSIITSSSSSRRRSKQRAEL